ncbi:hypothetical protein AMS59_04555 [Lysinibacillus sp. FJAT-14745]|uniref:DUF488 domain-containing protein n=1 Tax=Lysinibacillus sp. FJAT-14745 TaxID=1704289 RepID=UPI0006ABE49C|nr:DUF488 domain-containing protein [Lysinibacillus sp. FJAT-14745]KOP80649.1 hypothetical protein AMS59_04555 [Lysinibacillus sp. FJAT-14745]
MEFLTIGVYGYSEEEFFKTLKDAEVDLFIDIRQRRGVRGKQYSFVNSTYLQQKLKEVGISYRHEKALAPTTEIRNAQKVADKQNNVLKINRSELGNVFKEMYQREILADFDFDNFLKEILDMKYKNIVLFCVESTPLACHRGLVAEKLKQLEYTTRHITK